MTIDTSVGSEEPRDPDQSNLTDADVDEENDRNTSADERGRSGKTNRIKDDTIELGKP